jgi:hypothetical protein
MPEERKTDLLADELRRAVGEKARDHRPSRVRATLRSVRRLLQVGDRRRGSS